MTVMLTPFMSCTAKIPIYGFFASTFFPKYSGLITVGLYFLGIFTGVIVALISKNTAFKGEAVPFVMELPNYRLPGAKNVIRLLWDKAKDFLQRAFTVIFLATIVVWFLQSFDFRLTYLGSETDTSILSVIAGYLAPVFKPIGLGDWRIVTALITGFMAKESVVSTLEVLISDISEIMTPLSAGSMLVFSLLYTPCVAAIASIKRELGAKWAMGIVVLQCSVAWVCAFIVRMILMAAGV